MERRQTKGREMRERGGGSGEEDKGRRVDNERWRRRRERGGGGGRRKKKRRYRNRRCVFIGSRGEKHMSKNLDHLDAEFNIRQT